MCVRVRACARAYFIFLSNADVYLRRIAVIQAADQMMMTNLSSVRLLNLTLERSRGEHYEKGVIEGAHGEEGGGVECGIIDDAVIHPPDEGDEDEDCGFSGGGGADGCPGRRHGYPGRC